jgi:hypothetical protein
MLNSPHSESPSAPQPPCSNPAPGGPTSRGRLRSERLSVTPTPHREPQRRSLRLASRTSQNAALLETAHAASPLSAPDRSGSPATRERRRREPTRTSGTTDTGHPCRASSGGNASHHRVNSPVTRGPQHREPTRRSVRIAEQAPIGGPSLRSEPAPAASPRTAPDRSGPPATRERQRRESTRRSGPTDTGSPCRASSGGNANRRRVTSVIRGPHHREPTRRSDRIAVQTPTTRGPSPHATPQAPSRAAARPLSAILVSSAIALGEDSVLLLLKETHPMQLGAKTEAKEANHPRFRLPTLCLSATHLQPPRGASPFCNLMRMVFEDVTPNSPSAWLMNLHMW